MQNLYQPMLQPIRIKNLIVPKIYPNARTDYENFVNGFFYKKLIDEKDNSIKDVN